MNLGKGQAAATFLIIRKKASPRRVGARAERRRRGETPNAYPSYPVFSGTTPAWCSDAPVVLGVHICSLRGPFGPRDKGRS